MFELKVTVEIPGLPESINNLAAALSGAIHHTADNVIPFPTAATTAPAQTVTAPVSSPAPVQPTVNSPASVAPPVEQAAPAPVAPPVTTPAPTPAPTSAPATQKAVTMKEVARVGAELVDHGKMSELIALLKTFGVVSITQLKPEMLNDFAAQLRPLGANI